MAGNLTVAGWLPLPTRLGGVRSTQVSGDTVPEQL